MDIQLNETQEMLRTSAREFLSENCPPTTIRAVRKSGQGQPPGLWQQLGELGWLGLALPEAAGGSGMSFLDLCVLIEEMGYACVPSLFADVTAGSGLLLGEAGAEAHAETLERVATGDSILVPAFNGWHDADGYGKLPEAVRDSDGFVLNGTHLFVHHGASASQFLCRARATDQPGEALLVVPADTEGVLVTALDSAFDNRPCRLDLQQVRLPASAFVTQDGPAAQLVSHARQRMDVARCMDNVGALTWVLEDTVAYARERRQFGQPIGSFQVLQHYCADMHIMLEALRMSTYHAAWRISEGLDAGRDAAIACACAHDVIPRFMGLAHQVHGAMGVTYEHDLYLYSTHVTIPGHGLTPLTEYLESALST